MDKTGYSILKTIRLTKDEAENLKKKAETEKMSEAAYVRMLLSQKPNQYPEIRLMLRQLINEINKIGVNINQIVFHHNAGLYDKSDKERLTAYMRKITTLLDEAVEKIGNY